jgi:hypothetical protein
MRAATLLLLAQSADDVHREAAARALLTNFTAGRFEEVSRTFNGRMLAALPPPKLASFAEQLAAQPGAFQKVRETKQSVEKGEPKRGQRIKNCPAAPSK